jgi:hypothetical protein
MHYLRHSCFKRLHEVPPLESTARARALRQPLKQVLHGYKWPERLVARMPGGRDAQHGGPGALPEAAQPALCSALFCLEVQDAAAHLPARERRQLGASRAGALEPADSR